MNKVLVVVDNKKSVVFAGDQLRVHNTHGGDTEGGILLVSDGDTQIGVFSKWRFWMRLDEKYQVISEKPLWRPLTSQKILTVGEEINLWNDLKKLKTCMETIDDRYNGVVKRYMGGYHIIDSWIDKMGKQLEEIAEREFEIRRKNVGAPESVNTPEKLAKWIKSNTKTSK